MTATLFGALAGVGGLVHGIGEVLQGNVAPEGLIINSWTVGPIATNMGGEPGMTIVPNLQITADWPSRRVGGNQNQPPAEWMAPSAFLDRTGPEKPRRSASWKECWAQTAAVQRF